MTANNRRTDYLYMFRKCKTLDTVEKLYEHKRDSISGDEIADFNGAYDHRKAEIIHGKLWDKVPASAWKFVT